MAALARYPVLAQRRSDLASWWGNRTPRERRLLIALGGTALLVLLVMAIYRPLADARARAVADIRTYEALAAQLRIAGPELARLRAMDRSAAPALVTRTASGYGLTIGRIEPAGGALRVTLQNADFTQLVQWLVQLETTSTLRVSNIRIERTAAAGIVNAQIALKG
jgi:general secretion pathway protein M